MTVREVRVRVQYLARLGEPYRVDQRVHVKALEDVRESERVGQQPGQQRAEECTLVLRQRRGLDPHLAFGRRPVVQHKQPVDQVPVDELHDLLVFQVALNHRPVGRRRRIGPSTIQGLQDGPLRRQEPAHKELVAVLLPDDEVALLARGRFEVDVPTTRRRVRVVRAGLNPRHGGVSGRFKHVEDFTRDFGVVTRYPVQHADAGRIPDNPVIARDLLIVAGRPGVRVFPLRVALPDVLQQRIPVPVRSLFIEPQDEAIRRLQVYRFRRERCCLPNAGESARLPVHRDLGHVNQQVLQLADAVPRPRLRFDHLVDDFPRAPSEVDPVLHRLLQQRLAQRHDIVLDQLDPVIFRVIVRLYGPVRRDHGCDAQCAGQGDGGVPPDLPVRLIRGRQILEQHLVAVGQQACQVEHLPRRLFLALRSHALRLCRLFGHVQAPPLGQSACESSPLLP